MFEMLDGYDVQATRKQAREEERKAQAIELAKEMLSDGEPIVKIMKYTKLTKKAIDELEEKIQKK